MQDSLLCSRWFRGSWGGLSRSSGRPFAVDAIAAACHRFPSPRIPAHSLSIIAGRELYAQKRPVSYEKV